MDVLKKINLGTRMLLGFLLILSIFLAINYFSFREIDILIENSKQKTHTHEVIVHIEKVVSTLKDAETGQRGFIITGQDKFLEPYNSALSELPWEIQILRDLTLDNQNQQNNLDTLETLVSAKLADLKEKIDLRKSKGFEETSKSVSVGTGNDVMNQIRQHTNQMEKEEQSLLLERETAFNKTHEQVNTILLFGSIAGVILSLLVIVMSLQSVFSLVKRPIGEAVTQILAAVNQLSTSSQQASAAAQQNSAISQQVATGAAQQSKQAEQISKAVSQMSSAVQQMAASGEESSNIANQVSQVAQKTGENAEKINKIVDTISNIASQTNLLALNAAIEAARAGDAGRGFAVVADEVRKLAESSSQASDEVRNTVKEITSNISQTVKGIQQVTFKIQDVSAGAQQQAASVTQIAKAMDSIASIAEQNSTGSQQLSSGSLQQANAAVQVSAAVAQLQKMSKQLQLVANSKTEGEVVAINMPIASSPTPVITQLRVETKPLEVPEISLSGHPVETRHLAAMQVKEAEKHTEQVSQDVKPEFIPKPPLVQIATNPTID